jgi:hypothetical protein
VDAARWIPELCTIRRLEVAHLEAEEGLVEAGDRTRVGTVDGDADPSNGVRAHTGESSRNPDPAMG